MTNNINKEMLEEMVDKTIAEEKIQVDIVEVGLESIVDQVTTLTAIQKTYNKIVATKGVNRVLAIEANDVANVINNVVSVEEYTPMVSKTNYSYTLSSLDKEYRNKVHTLVNSINKLLTELGNSRTNLGIFNRFLYSLSTIRAKVKREQSEAFDNLLRNNTPNIHINENEVAPISTVDLRILEMNIPEIFIDSFSEISELINYVYEHKNNEGLVFLSKFGSSNTTDPRDIISNIITPKDNDDIEVTWSLNKIANLIDQEYDEDDVISIIRMYISRIDILVRKLTRTLEYFTDIDRCTIHSEVDSYDTDVILSGQELYLEMIVVNKIGKSTSELVRLFNSILVKSILFLQQVSKEQ